MHQEFTHIWDLMNEDGYQLEMLQLIKECISFLVCETGLDFEDFLIKVVEPTVEDNDIDCPGNFEFKMRLVGTEAKREDYCSYSARELGLLILGFQSGHREGGPNLNEVCWNKKKYIWVREGEYFFYKVTDILPVRHRNGV